ncbi:MAG: RelA/SpoT family protein [Bacteroidetes bacterium]|nr:RelA/SpoT family protein [Bacteroidota bacterium]
MSQLATIPPYTLNAEQEKKEILRQYRSLLRLLKSKLKKGDKELLRVAFEIAADAHRTMRRKTGEPYILHPLAVAQICVEEIGLGVRSTICALLHDTVEDTDVTLDDLEHEFGSEIARIIDGLTKISNVVDTNSTQQAENFKKILLTLTDDPRVILIKLADRLHNMRTLDGMRREKQLKIASETIYIYAPLAHRLGLYNIKTEMEDLSMKYMEPDIYRDIAKKLAETKRERSRYINEFIKPVKERMEKAGFTTFDIYGRPKSIHSISNKIKKKGVSFEEVYDLFAIRIIIDAPQEKEKEECWKAYSIVTDMYTPSPERMRDWLSNPKNNGYEALHTTVMGPQGKWVEVQIRSRRMNEIAEKGLAAHWKYKEGSGDEDRFDKWFQNIREVLNNQESSSLDFLQDFKSSFLAEEIYVYTPKGDVKMLPVGATALDFAFHVHSDVGSHCIGAKVNHKLVPIAHKLRSGDQVEIITSSKQKPGEDWLNIVVTAKARNRIKDALKEEKRKIADEGKYIIQRKLEQMGVAYDLTNIEVLTHFFKQPSHLEFYYKVANKYIDLKELKEVPVHGDRFELPKPVKPAETRIPYDPSKALPGKDSELIIFGESSDKIVYTLANCCKPIPGDDVFGFVSMGKGLIIHRTNCPNATRLLSNFGHRVVKTKWAKHKEISFLTGIKIIGVDDVGAVSKILSLVSGEMKLNISAITIEAKEGVFEGNIRLFVRDKDELDRLVSGLLKLPGIDKVERYDTEQ